MHKRQKEYESYSKTAAERLALAASGRDANQAWKQDSAEALKTAKNRGESHLSAARCVGQFLFYRLASP